jgi:diguanylate cyclase (GGDEF)-like protein
VELREALGRVKRTVERYRAWGLDAIFLLAVMTFATYLAYGQDLLANAAGVLSKAHIVDLDEALALGLLFCTCLLVFGGRRLSEMNRETKRRILAEREARVLALHDPLTALPNRRQFNTALEAAIAAPPRAGACHAVFMLDLNGFKMVNDVHGHAVGDELLVHIGGRFARAMRSGDIVARLGGDEFAVLANHLLGPEEATGIALRILDSLKEPVAIGCVHHRVGAGLGIALFPQDGKTGEDILRRADIALYRAKTDGVSSMRIFEPGMDARVRERDFLETVLR